jgi:hypothetical protein
MTTGTMHRGIRPRWAGLRLALAAALAAAVSTGCIPPRAISSRAVDYNVAAEEARSEMLLLNVLRARDRKPMVFTGLTHFSGSLRASAGIGATVETGPDAGNLQVFTPSVEASDAPSFDVAVLDSQEFTRGIMTPLRFETAEYFWDQGFNRELLLLLAVERVEIVCPGRNGAAQDLRILDNDPQNPEFGAFQSLLYAMADSGRWEPDPHQVEAVGPPVDAASLARPETLIQIAGSELELRPVANSTFQVERPTTKRRLAVPGIAVCGAAEGELRLYDSKVTFEKVARRAPEEIRGRIVFRSPQSVLYYLGELIRPGGERVLLRPRSTSQTENSRRLLVVREGGGCARADVRVQYDGSRFQIPRGIDECDPGRSMQVLAFAGQLLSLQQSSRDMPAVGTFRVVGQ